jgi:hypothetical protein
MQRPSPGLSLVPDLILVVLLYLLYAMTSGDYLTSFWKGSNGLLAD